MVADDLFHQLYHAEWQRRAAIQGDTALPLGVLALLGSGLIVLLKEYNAGGGILDVLFWIGFAVGSAAYVIGIYLLVRSFHGYEYLHLSFPSELKQHWDGLRAHHSALGTPLLADREFETYLQDQLINVTDQNTENNVNRAEYLQKANRAIIIVLIATGLTAIPYSIRERLKDQPTVKVEITNRGLFSMSQNPGAGSAPAPKPVVPPKPVPPAPFVERTGVRAPANRNPAKR